MRQTTTDQSDPGRAGLLKRLERDKREWERWRKNRRGGERIPEYLWAIALSYVGELSLSRISREFRVNFDGLKQMNAQGPKTSQEQGRRAPEFIDVTRWLRGDAGDFPNPDSQPAGSLVLERPDGNPLRIEGALPEVGYLEAVVGLFFGFRR